jgi:hypothetical protein
MAARSSSRILRHSGWLLASVLVTTVGCTAAASPSVAPSAAATAVVVPSVAPSPPPATPSPTATPIPSVAPSPSAATAVGPAPAGPWTAVRWVRLGKTPLGPHNVTVLGWSGGYVALQQNGGSDENGNELPVVIQTSASPDGLTWSAPTTMNASGLKGMIEVSTIVEGPHGLLALGFPFGDTCGGPEPLAALWTSPDGSTWTRVPLPKDFRTGTVAAVEGGPAGFIALGTKADGETQGIWTSGDGAAWRARPLPKISSGTLVLDSVASFDDGFVLSGAVLGEGGCGGPGHIHGATWVSADGSSWTRASLPGASTVASATFTVQALSDRALLVTQGLPNSTLGWTSTDARTWTPVAGDAGNLPYGQVSDGRHDIQVIGPDTNPGPLTVQVVNEDATMAELAQSGDGPIQTDDDPGFGAAVGPTGVLIVSDDGERSWLGLPS